MLPSRRNSPNELDTPFDGALLHGPREHPDTRGEEVRPILEAEKDALAEGAVDLKV